MVFDFDLLFAERLESGNVRHSHVGPVLLYGGNGLYYRLQLGHVVIAEEVRKDEFRPFAVHLDGNNDDASAKSHELCHTVIEHNRLEGKGVARRKQRVAFFKRVRFGDVGKRLLNSLDRLQSVRHSESDEARVPYHQIGGSKTKNGVHYDRECNVSLRCPTRSGLHRPCLYLRPCWATTRT